MAVGIYVENLTEVRRALERYAPELVPVMRTLVKGAIDSTSVEYIRGRVPFRLGDAANAIKTSASGTAYFIRAGDDAPYFGWLDFGGVLKPSGGRRGTQVRPKVKGGRYVYPGFFQSMPELVRAEVQALDQVTTRFNNS